MPSVYELNQLFLNKSTAFASSGAAPSGIYWSSTESSRTNAYALNFTGGAQSSVGKTTSDRVRCIRAF